MVVRGGGRGRCAACSHPQKAAIEGELAGGSSLRGVSARYGISKSSLNRHLANHSNPALVALVKERSTGRKRDRSAPLSLTDQLRGLVRRAETFLDGAERAGNVPQGLSAIRELRSTLELLGRASGELSDRPGLVVNLVATAEYVELRTTLVQILAKYPQAQLEVADALARAEGVPS